LEGRRSQLVVIVNFFLFSPDEIGRPLPRSDPRARHLLEILHRAPGDSFDAGLINGPRGRATLVALLPDSLTLSFSWPADPSSPTPSSVLRLIIGLPRPQTARDILRDATALGVDAMLFVVTEKSDRSYAQSSLWTEEEWRRHVQAGAEQAFDTRLPEVTHNMPLAGVLAALPGGDTRLALDNYEAPTPLSRCLPAGDVPLTLALGPERGWSAADRASLRAHGFALAHLGPRVLRTETAVTAALALVKAARGSM
jgi:RsmE family RNA methyltransferase